MTTISVIKTINKQRIMAKKITGCVFDLDGTLADTAPDIALAPNKSLNDFGLRQVPLSL